MKLFRTRSGIVAEQNNAYVRLSESDWTALITRDDLEGYLAARIADATPAEVPRDNEILAPLEQGEVWAAGVTYYRSRTARMEESKAAGGGSFYDRVYDAERPELFFKSTPHRTVGPGGAVHIRSDSKWNVPEPELGLVVTPNGKLVGYTIGNDMSSRDIEGENPLYLPQAKVYERSCALGPAVLVTAEDLAASTTIRLEVIRKERTIFDASTSLAELKRKPKELIEFLFRENSFPNGCVLLTGTGIVPSDDFSLAKGDLVRISIDGIGTLINTVD